MIPRTISIVVTLLVLVLPAPAASAYPEEPGDEQGLRARIEGVVVAVSKAHADGDDAGLRRLAAPGIPDPFLVVEVLCWRAPAAAQAFAAASIGADHSRLAAYVTRRVASAPAGSEIDALLSAGEEFEGQAWAMLAQREAGGRDVVVDAAIGLWRAEALYALRKPQHAADVALEAAKRARRIGWLRLARRACQVAAQAARPVGAYDLMLGAFEELEQVETRAERPLFVAMAVFYQGNVRMELGQFGAAIDRLAGARSRFDKLGRGDEMARTQNALATALRLKGEHSDALMQVEGGLALARLPMTRARLLQNLGQVRTALGEHDAALEAYEAALEVVRGIGVPALTAHVLGNVGVARKDTGDHAGAQEAFTEALRAFESLQDEQAVATALTNLGHLELEHGDPEKALVLCTQALEMAKRVKGPWLISNAELNVAEALLGLRRYDAAAEGFERNIRLARQLGSAKPALEGHLGVARARLAQGDATAALAAAREGIRLLGTLVHGLAEGQDAHARAQHAVLFEVAVEAAASLGDAAAVVEVIEAGRAMALLESLEGRDELRDISIPKEHKEEEAAARAGLAEARVHHKRAVEKRAFKEIGRRREILDAANARLEAVIARIQRAAKQGSALAYPEVDDLETLMGYARPGEAFVLYALTTSHYVAVVIERKRARIVMLGARGEIDTLSVDVARASAGGAALSIRGFRVSGTRDGPADSKTLLPRLRKLIVEPLALEEDVRRLLLSPTGNLFLVPLSALVGEREIAYVPSGTTYGVLRPTRDVRGASILALGGVDYSSNPGLSDLPGTQAESKAVGDQVLLGKQASEAGLRKVLASRPRWRGVHFACHGLLDMDHPMRSALALAEGGADDGMLSVLEVFTMKVPTDLVVLSACETGRGRIYRAEGILGLTRAFMYAGAPRVLCSLWKVDDDATRALMTRFYELWNPRDAGKGISAAAALRQAQEHVRAQDKWKSPYFWAAWVLWGLPD
jgi:CHAT domain-containing protein/tetratricopeptide (TPR) repeat protein